MKKETITFPTFDPYILRDMHRPSVRDNPRRGQGFLHLPDGAAPDRKVPGVIVVEGLGGMKPERELAYGKRLADNGFAAVLVDSFGPRGFSDAMHDHRALRVTESMMLADTFGALRALADRPEVAPDRISVMGFSYGGMITVLAAYECIRAFFVEGDEMFASHVSYYGTSAPRCEDTRTTGAKVLIMLGELDENVNIDRSLQIADDLRDGGSEVDMRVFHGAYHQWNGGDIEKRFERFSLHNLKTRVTADGSMVEESLGISIDGIMRRAVAVASGTNIWGYYMLQDDRVMEESDALAFDLMRDAVAPGRANKETKPAASPSPAPPKSDARA